MLIDFIGAIRTPFDEAEGTPIQPRAAKGAAGTVEVRPEYAEGLKDLDGFERVWLIYAFDRIDPSAAKESLIVRPYMDDTERGVFSTRAPCRPNAIGMSCVRLVSVEGCVLHVEDVDMLDGTPLVDIKPYAPSFDCFEVERTGWIGEAASRRRLEDAKADDRFHASRDGPVPR